MVIITYACFHTLFYEGIQSKLLDFNLHRTKLEFCTLSSSQEDTPYTLGGAPPTFTTWGCWVLTLQCNESVSAQLLCALQT